MNEDKKLMSAIVIVAIAIFLISGGTLAYWQWVTSTEQETLVNVSLTDDASMYIDFPSEEMVGLYPTSDCDPNGTSSWVTEITVDNRTGVLLATNFKLKVKIEDKNGNVITNVTNPGNSKPNRQYIKFAVTAENESCQNALYTGVFDENIKTFGEDDTSGWYDSKLITLEGSDGFPLVSGKIGSGVSFHAKANGETKQRFRVYAWLDKEYTSVNVGTEVTDTMQDAKVTVSWSENSTLEQVKRTKPAGEAYAVYSEDDNSLRFYRSTTPITQGSTYNGRTVTNVYTGFENTQSSDASPWLSLGSSVTTVVFEDYIYPKSTYDWFEYFINVTSIDLSKLDTSNVTDMSYMFFGVEILGNIIGIEDLNTSSVTNMNGMFEASNGLTSLDLSNWDTSNVTNMSFMFYGSSVTSLNFDGWNVCNVTNYESFENNDITSPYFGHPRLCKGDIKGQAYAVYSEDDSSLRFYRSETPITVGSTYNGKSVTTVWTDFENSTSSAPPWYSKIDSSSLTEIVFEDYIYPRVTTQWFNDLYNVGSIDLAKLDTSSVTNMTYMFRILQVSNLDVSHFDTSNVTSFSGMFYMAGGFTSLDLSGWDTSNVTSMQSMFLAASSITSLNLDGWDVSNVTNMNEMFNAVSSNLILDLSDWNVCKISTRPTNFSSNSNIIEPNWGMSCS